MCGLAGFVGKGDHDDIRRMTRALAHRGPDGEGFLHDPDTAVHLGHRRLAIIDIAGGVQPMFSEDGRVAVVYNGEIFNHMELRAELIAAGRRFRTDHSDTEVLVQGYEQWGEDLPTRLNGQFAFAIYDARRRRIFLARDRFGEKPLYYTHQNGTFAFASEAGALAAHARLGFSIDSLGLQKFFAHGFTPGETTIYRECRKLSAGHSLSFDIGQARTATRCYWRFALEPDDSLTEADAPRLAEETRSLVFESVRRRMLSDVPLGFFLSGGIDSTAVVAGAARHRPGASLDTFTIGFNDPSFDESGFAARAAAHFGTRHHADMLSFETARDLIPSVLERLDEPLGDASILPTYLVSQFARKSVTVALSGDGGDEMFGGYDPFKALLPARLYAALVPGGVHRGLRRCAELLPISRGNMALDFKVKRFLRGLSYPAPYWNPVWLSPVEPQDLAEIVNAPVRIEEVYSEVLDCWESAPVGSSLVDRTLQFYTRFYLTDDVLMKVDRAAMMNSLETRAVFLDNDLVDFCRKLPAQFKYSKGTGKIMLRQALRGAVPDEVLDRPKKGFGVPISRWLREIPPPDLDTLPQMRSGAARKLWARHAEGVADERLALWCCLSLHHHLKAMQGDAPVMAVAS